jgi:hypothetical protein
LEIKSSNREVSAFENIIANTAIRQIAIYIFDNDLLVRISEELEGKNLL